MQLKLSGSVGSGGKNSKSDVLAVQMVLSKVMIAKSTAKGRRSLVYLWKEISWNGKSSPELVAAIKDYQQSRGLKVSGKIESSSATAKKLFAESNIIQETHGFRMDDKKHLYLIATKLKIQKIILNAKVEANRISLYEPLPNKEAQSLGELIKSFASRGLEVVITKVNINRSTGRFEVGLGLIVGQPPAVLSFNLTKAGNILQSLTKASDVWKPVKLGVDSIYKIQSKETYAYLKIGNQHISKVAIDDWLVPYVGISRSDYTKSKIIKDVVDAIYVEMQKPGISNDSHKVYKSLLQILHAKLPNKTFNLAELILYKKKIGIDEREIVPLYALGFELALSFALSIGLKAQIIIDPNTRLEYFFLEVGVGVGGKFKADLGLELLNKSISDFASFDVKPFANAEAGINVGAFVVSIKLKAALPKASYPEWTYEGKLKDVLDLEGLVKKALEQEHKKNKSKSIELTFVKWDVGIAEFSISLAPQARIGADVDLGAGFKFSALFDIDSSVLDKKIYSFVPGPDLVRLN